MTQETNDCNQEPSNGSGPINQESEIESLRSEVSILRQQLANTQRRLDEVYNSTRYKLGSAFADGLHSPGGLVRLPFKLLRLGKSRQQYTEGLSPALPERYNALRRNDRSFRKFERRFQKFLEHVKTSDTKTIVFILSGTIEIQNIRGNRPIRLANSYLRSNIPVFFSYHRWRKTDAVPVDEDPNLLQSPIDYTLAIANQLAEAEFGEQHKIFLVSYPYPGVERILNRFNMNGWYTLYDCRDDWEEFSKIGAAKWYRSDLEKFIVTNTDVTTCVSRPLQEKIRNFTSLDKVRLSPNALDTDFVLSDYRHTPAINQIVIGYFGHLSDGWFDWDAIIAAADAMPHVRFELIGHSAPEIDRLPMNIYLLGPKTPKEIGQYAARWHVGVIPFRSGKLTTAVDPIKIYEYLALGLPTVAIGMPQVRDYPGTELVEDSSEFVPALQRAITLNLRSPEVKEFLQKNTWDLRSEELIQLARDFGQTSLKSFMTKLGSVERPL